MRCNTDLSTCCAGSNRAGEWYFPDETLVPFSDFGGDIYRIRNAQRVILKRRNNAMGPSGLYRCEVPTVLVNDDVDRSLGETAYVGLYASGGIRQAQC